VKILSYFGDFHESMDLIKGIQPEALA